MEEHNAHKKSYMIEEWRECQNFIASLDRIILSLRKFALGGVLLFVIFNVVLTSLRSNTMVLLYRYHIVASLLLLSYVCLIYVLDTNHQVYLREAVRRAVNIEKQIDFDFSVSIFAKSFQKFPSLGGFGYYAFLCFLSIIPSMILTTSVAGFFQIMQAVMFIAFMLTLFCFSWLFLLRCDKNIKQRKQ